MSWLSGGKMNWINHLLTYSRKREESMNNKTERKEKEKKKKDGQKERKKITRM